MQESYLPRENFEEQLQPHDSSTPSSSSVDQRQGIDSTDNAVLQRFQKINERVTSLRHDSQMPLLLMGTKALCSLYQLANPCTSAFCAYTTEHEKSLSSESLHQRAWKIVAPHFQQVKQQAISQYRHSALTQQTSTDLPDIVRAAHNGQVETLLMAAGKQVWGHFNLQTDKIEVQKRMAENSDDLLDLAAVQTWLRGGRVHVLEQMPVDNVPLAAILRRSMP
ncbi:MAG: hypothetical protein AAF329_13865 [Cyanobacteria bacterium P01_A01_bin.17]